MWKRIFLILKIDKKKMIKVTKIIGISLVITSLATTGLIGAAVGIRVVFVILLVIVRNPSLRGQLFSYARLGFAFVEATGLFAFTPASLLR